MSTQLNTIYGTMVCHSLRGGEFMAVLVDPIGKYEPFRRANACGLSQTHALSNLFKAIDEEMLKRQEDPIRYDVQVWIKEIVNELDVLFEMKLDPTLNAYIEAKLIEEIYSRFNVSGVKQRDQRKAE